MADYRSKAWRSLVVAGLIAALGGCSTPPVRETGGHDATRIEAPPVIEAPEQPAETASAAEVPPEPPRPDPWSELIAGFGTVGCTDTPLVQTWKKRYSPAYPHFANMLQRSAAAMMYVHQQLRQHDLPSEFALLPIVESQYTPFATTGNRPAGVWQLMPDTARDAGLVVDRRRDQRLDLQASTAAATRLLATLAQEFDRNWQLVDYAYNAGHFSVLGAMKGQVADTLPGRLRLPAITHEHWAKLCALSAILSRPDDYGLSLPKLSDDELLSVYAVPHDVALSDLATLTGTDAARLTALNAGWPRGRIPAGSTVLLPKAALDILSTRVEEIPQAAAVAQTSTGNPQADDTQENYVVRSGDNLWSIARRFGTRVDDLMRSNSLSGHQLRPGQRLRIVTAPDAK